jgi:two-component system sensor histidine kinase BaeS
MSHAEPPPHRPPWWPEAEPWPPQGRRRWRNGPPPFVRRLFVIIPLALLAMFVLVVAVITLIFWVVASHMAGAPFNPNPGPGFRGPGFGIVLLLFVGVMFLFVTGVARAVRRAAMPITDFMQGVERVADGDFEARIRERGPRDVRALARAFNGMAARLQDNESQRRGLLADVTHELRTPLTVIQGNLEGLLDGVYPADPAHLTTILEETQVLSRLIDDLRTLSLAESGTLALHREPTDLGVLAGETASAFRPQAEAAGVRLALEVGDDLPLLAVDPVRLSEVLNNLVANALRYTPQGGTVTISGKPAEDGGAVLQVRDTGAGIPPEARPHVFDRFYKSADSHGSGLGLAIAKNLIAAHGGQLSVESEVGQGTVMTVRLPGE